MTKTITLTKPIIHQVVVDFEQETVRAIYTLTNEAGTVGESGELIFWKTLPTPEKDVNGNDIPLPETWIQLPTAAKSGLAALATYIKGRVTALLSDTPGA